MMHPCEEQDNAKPNRAISALSDCRKCKDKQGIFRAESLSRVGAARRVFACACSGGSARTEARGVTFSDGMDATAARRCTRDKAVSRRQARGGPNEPSTAPAGRRSDFCAVAEKTTASWDRKRLKAPVKCRQRSDRHACPDAPGVDQAPIRLI